MHIKLTIAYDGTAFRGWARQPGRRTVEGALAAGLETLYAQVGRLTVAGRTDSGVHALRNVVSVTASGGPPPDRAVEALNAVLPHDVAVISVEQAGHSFDARRDAEARSYRYRIWRSRVRSPFEVNRSLWHPAHLDLQRLQASAAMLIGEHDFRAFTPTETQHTVFRRVVEDARWHDRGETVEFEITADSFLRHMVRTLVGTMLELEPAAILDLLRGAPRAAAGSTAAPGGLYLVKVRYPSDHGESAPQ